MTTRQWLAPLVGATVLVSACSSGGGGEAEPQTQATFADVDCNLSAFGPIAGPLDQAQQTLIEQTAQNLGENEEIGEASVALITGISRFLDLVDGLAATSTVLLTEQDVRGASDALFGSAQSVQCGAISLADAFEASPLATAAPQQVNELVRQLAELTQVIDGVDTLGPEGLEGLTMRLADISRTLAELPEFLPNDVAVIPGSTEFLALLESPAGLLRNLADVLDDVGVLDGQGTADGISATLTDLLANLSAVAPDDPFADALMQADEQIANGLGLVLVPLFDAIREQFVAGGLNAAAFADFLIGALSGEGDAFSEGIIAGGEDSSDGMTERPTLEEQLAGIPVLGELLATVLGAGGGGDGESVDGGAFFAQLLAGGEGLPSLAEALESLTAAVTGTGEGEQPPPTLAELLSDILVPLQGNAIGDAVNALFDELLASPVDNQLIGVLTPFISGFLEAFEGFVDTVQPAE